MPTQPIPALGWLQAQYQQAGQLINDVATEVGLSASTAPLASTDNNFVQLKTLANLLGRDMLRKYEWELLTRTFTFTTVDTGGGPPDGLTTYPLPNDYFKVINQTAWNRTSRLPMAGPLSAQQWEWLVGLVSNQFTIYLGFRVWGGVFAVFSSPNPANQEIAFEYLSNSWVLPASAPSGDPDLRTPLIAAAGDLVLFDPILFSRGLKMRFLEAKGFDSSAAAADFENAWEQVVGPDAAAAKLNLSDTSWGLRYLDGWSNVPPSGFGMGM